MHDTLKNRGRVTYDQYGPEQTAEIKNHAQQFLAGEIDEITEFESLRKVREYFTQIRGMYRKLKQNIEAVQRQIASDPSAAQKLLAEKSAHELPTKAIPEGGDAGEEEKENKKRPPTDKQTAFTEFKT